MIPITATGFLFPPSSMLITAPEAAPYIAPVIGQSAAIAAIDPAKSLEAVANNRDASIENIARPFAASLKAETTQNLPAPTTTKAPEMPTDSVSGSSSFLTQLFAQRGIPVYASTQIAKAIRSYQNTAEQGRKSTLELSPADLRKFSETKFGPGLKAPLNPDKTLSLVV